MAKIVLIDDSDHTSNYLKMVLIQAGHQVVTPVAGEDLFNQMQANEPDLVIIDPFFAKGDCQPRVEQIKRRFPRIPIFVWSARNKEKNNQITCQADAYFLKNVLAADLIRDIVMRDD